MAAMRMTPTRDVISVESVDTSPGTALTNLNPNGVTSALLAPEVPESLEMTPTRNAFCVESVDIYPGTALTPGVTPVTALTPNGVTNALPAPEVPETLEMIADDQDSKD